MKILTILISIFSFSLFAHTQKIFVKVPLKIITIGHPTLKLMAKEVEHSEIFTSEFQNFIDDLIETMSSAGGVGLAAPQVNVSKRVFVIKPNLFAKAQAMINPKLEYLEAYGKKNSKESCLSIPGKSFRVPRYKQINVSYYDRDGQFQVEEAKGFKAIVIQHEYDHLNGTLISDLFNYYPETIEIEFDEELPKM